MAHELDTREDGSAAFMGRRTAWHSKGTVIGDRDVSLDEALELSGTNFRVETRPVLIGVEKPAGDDGDTFTAYEEIDNRKAIVRTDRAGAAGVLGVMKDRYTPLQNRDAFEVFGPLIDNGIAKIETAGALRGGRDVWMLVRLDIDSPIVREVFGPRTLRDGTKTGGTIPYVLVSNNHSGERQVRVMETPIEVVCANTLGAAHASFGKQKSQGTAFEVRHTASVERKTTEAAIALFGDVVKRYESIAKAFAVLRATKLDDELFRRLVLDVATPIAKKLDAANMTKRQETARIKIDESRFRLTAMFEGGATGIDDDRSAWSAYMAVTEAVDHTDVFATRGGDESRIESLFDGKLLDVKTATLDSLVGFGVESGVAASLGF